MVLPSASVYDPELVETPHPGRIAVFEQLLARVKHSSKIRSKTDIERRRRRLEALKRYDQSPRGRFKQQKRNAKVRDVGWELTYEQWAGIWAKSGHWDQRGNWKKGYVMMRLGDTGPYSVENVMIGRHIDNTAERNRIFHRLRAELQGRPEEWFAAETGEPVEPEDPFDETPF